jgi:hypothetical protein
VLADARPRYFVLENVYALTYSNKASRPAYERLLKEIGDAGITGAPRSSMPLTTAFLKRGPGCLLSVYRRTSRFLTTPFLHTAAAGNDE